MSAMRITPSSIIRDSGAISSRCSASASDSISSSRESTPGDMNSISRWNRLRLSLTAARRGEFLTRPVEAGCAGCGSDIAPGRKVNHGRSLPEPPLDKCASLKGCALAQSHATLRRFISRTTPMADSPSPEPPCAHSRHHPHRLSRLRQDHPAQARADRSARPEDRRDRKRVRRREHRQRDPGAGPQGADHPAEQRLRLLLDPRGPAHHARPTWPRRSARASWSSTGW